MKTKLMMVVAAVAVAFGACAETETVGGYTWTYRINGDTAVIGGDFYDAAVISPSPTGAVIIPDTLGGKPVTSIGETAFYNCTNLTSVTIPDSVTSIGDYAFEDCSGLTSVTIPDSVTSIGFDAFYGCSGLTSMMIPDSVTHIGDQAFSGCSGLTSVTIGNGVAIIGGGTFAGCSSLTSVTIGNGVKSIMECAFYGCSGLKSVTIPASLTYIGDAAFTDCKEITSVFISDLAKWCNISLDDDIKSAHDLYLNGEKITDLVIPDGVTHIKSVVFSRCSGFTSVTIPGSVTNIESHAFEGCSGLTSVTIPGSVTSIGDWAFSGCSGLTSVTILDGVTSIGMCAFEDCSGLTSVTIPDSVTSISVSAFSGCSGLTSVFISDLAKWCNISFYDYIESAHDLYLNGEKITDLVIPDGVTHIEHGVFSRCSGLTSVTIPDSVTSIEATAFYGCSELTSIMVEEGNPNYMSVNRLLLSKDGKTLVMGVNGNVTIPDGVTRIEDNAFSGCSGLTSVTIPNSMTSIGSSAFRSCSGLASVTIPGSVMSIGYLAFDGTALATVHVVAGDANRVKTMLGNSGYDVSSITFVEDMMPIPEPDPVDPTPEPTPDPVTPGHEVLEVGDIVAPYEAPKAVTLHGVAYGGGAVVGVVELKLGKVNAKKKTSKVSGSFTGLDGKKITIKGVNVAGVDGAAPITVSLEVKGHGTMTVTIGGTQFAGSLGSWHVQSGIVGGNWTRAGAKVYVDIGGGRGATALPAGTIEALLPDGEPVIPKAGKWSFAKAASVKWAKPKKGAARPEIYVEESGKGLIVDDSKETNLSGLKLTYAPKTGVFKGSFKIYALEGSGRATKLKKYTVKVTGVVVDGVGHGEATCKRPAAGPWAVTVE